MISHEDTFIDHKNFEFSAPKDNRLWSGGRYESCVARIDLILLTFLHVAPLRVSMVGGSAMEELIRAD